MNRRSKNESGEATVKNQLVSELSGKTTELTELKDKFVCLVEGHDRLKTQLTKDDIEIKQLEYEKEHLEKRSGKLREDLAKVEKNSIDLEKRIFEQ